MDVINTLTWNYVEVDIASKNKGIKKLQDPRVANSGSNNPAFVKPNTV
jgi:hypothetical protein